MIDLKRRKIAISSAKVFDFSESLDQELDYEQYLKKAVQNSVPEEEKAQFENHTRLDNIKREQEMEDGIKRDEEINRKRLNPTPPAPVVTCPYCHSTNTKKISAGHRWLSTGLFGLASSDLGKQWKCADCGGKF